MPRPGFARFAVTPLALALLLAGCAARPALRAEHAWVRAAGAGEATAGYLDVVNDGEAPLALTGVSFAGADSVVLHATVRSGERSAMREVAAFDVPARGRLRFAPGGNHLMLAGLRGALAPGGAIEMTLRFAGGRELRVRAAVRG